MNFKFNKPILITLLYLFLFAGCEPIVEKRVPDYNDSILKDPSQIKDTVETIYNAPESPIQEPPEISYSIFDQRKTTIADPFNAETALKELYHGYTSADEYGDTSIIQTWKCSTCKQKIFEGEILEDSIAFPSSHGNDTRILALYHLGDSIKILATTTSEYAPYHERTGRFTCGILGLSLFRKTNNRWTLLHFNPAIGCFGMFQNVGKLELITYQNNYLLCLRNMFGGPGGPYTSDLIVIGIDHRGSKIVLEENNSDRTGIPNGGLWDSVLKITKTGQRSIPEKIQLTITGNYHYEEFIKEDTISNLPELLRNNMKQTNSHSFIITKNYLYKKEGYKLENEKIEQEK